MKYEIGARIRKYREAAGLNQKQLAALIGVSNGRVSNWEQGINRPDADIISEICRALNVSASELLDVNLNSNELTAHEKKLIQKYREKTELQPAINILLGINEI